jgi:hypothetical protein
MADAADYASWCSFSDDKLQTCDVAEVNLQAAVGLPGTERLDVGACRRRLDEWAEQVRHATLQWWPKFVAAPDQFDASAARFRMIAMITVLQRDLGVRYDPTVITGPYDARDARRCFIHGPLFGHGGTCSSLPVLYLAVGRRLDYPLRLVAARDHLFVRWDEPGERFNIECTSFGFVPRSDDHYRRWPLSLSDEQIQSHRYLVNMTPREELATFLSQRGHCWLDNLQWPLAIEAFHYAAMLDPRRGGGNLAVATMIARLAKGLKSRQTYDRGNLPAEIEQASPLATTSRERWALPIAKAELLRILPAAHLPSAANCRKAAGDYLSAGQPALY